MMGNQHSKSRGLRAAGALIFVLIVVQLIGVTSVAASHGGLPARHHKKTCLALAPGGGNGACRASARRLSGIAWNRWCRHHFQCAAHHLYLRPHFGLRGPVGRQLKPLPEGKYIRRFVREGWVYHLSPRIMMAIGLIESYGGTTSPAYMGCLRPRTYGSWWKQISCAAHVLDRFGLSGYNPGNPQYPAEIRAHARGIIIRSR